MAAALVLLGAERAGAQIVNGGFETGDFTGWTGAAFVNPNGSPTTGGPNFATFQGALADPNASPALNSNAVVSSQTTAFDGNGTAGPAVHPTQGNYLAFISNENVNGDGSLTGSYITQTFLVPAGAHYLSFDVRLLNNDDPLVFSAANDFGGVALSKGGTTLAQYNIDLDRTSTADAHVTPFAAVGGFQNSTPWLAHAFDVSGLGGQSVTLTAYALNYGGDNYVESRLLLDNVAIVPEPGPLALAAVGLSVALAYRAFRGRRCALSRQAAHPGREPIPFQGTGLVGRNEGNAA
jgi:hypothetical protein